MLLRPGRRSTLLLPRRRLFSTIHGGQVPKKGDRVVVAMSGGVDSSVTAKLLTEQDYDLSAVYMRNWDTRDENASDVGCEWEKDWEDVQRVCKLLGIPCRLVDLSREYWTRVFEPSLKVWESGGTPNPDVWCNREVKFGALFENLQEEDQWIATGHYARKGWAFSNKTSTTRPQLLCSSDPNKDQTYYLSSITEQGLAQTLFPLENITKPQVRELAAKAGLPTASKDESMGICFVGQKKRFRDFLAQYIPPNVGPILEVESKKVVGEHQGLWTFTIGEGAKIKGMASKMYVIGKSVETNTIYVSETDHPDFFLSTILAVNWCWIWADDPPVGLDSPQGFPAMVKFRHRSPSVPCIVKRVNSTTMQIVFAERQKALAEGQVAAIWDGDWCLGCGTIVLNA